MPPMPPTEPAPGPAFAAPPAPLRDATVGADAPALPAAPRSRDRRIDGLRGLMVLVMALDHFGGPLAQYTFQPFGFVSAAEGFVFLAGLVSGLVYTRLLRAPGHTLERRAFARAWKVYKYHVAAVLALLLVGAVSHVHGEYFARRDLAVERPLTTFGFALLLVNQPMLLDVLPMYVVFFFALPIALRQFAAGRAPLVIGVSTLLWLATQLSAPPLPPAAWGLPPGISIADFDYRAWQLLFVVGAWFGYRRAQGLAFAPPRAVVRAAWVVLVPLLVLRHAGIDVQALGLGAALERSWLGPLRLLDVAATFVLAHRLLAGGAQPLQRPWLTDIGQQSLQVFVLHAVAIYLFDPLRWRLGQCGWLLDTLVALAFVASLAVVARLLQRRAERSAATSA